MLLYFALLASSDRRAMIRSEIRETMSREDQYLSTFDGESDQYLDLGDSILADGSISPTASRSIDDE